MLGLALEEFQKLVELHVELVLSARGKDLQAVRVDVIVFVNTGVFDEELGVDGLELRAPGTLINHVEDYVDEQGLEEVDFLPRRKVQQFLIGERLEGVSLSLQGVAMEEEFEEVLQVSRVRN